MFVFLIYLYGHNISLGYVNPCEQPCRLRDRYMNREKIRHRTLMDNDLCKHYNVNYCSYNAVCVGKLQL